MGRDTEMCDLLDCDITYVLYLSLFMIINFLLKSFQPTNNLTSRIVVPC